MTSSDGGRGGGLAGADGRAEEGLLGVGAEILDQVARTGDKSAGAGERFRQRAADEVDLVVELEVIDGAAALPAEDAETVGVVDHGETAGLLADLRELRQAADVAFHRIHALDHEHFGRDKGNGFQDVPQVLGVVVAEALDRGHRQADAIPQAGMDIFIGEDHVALLRKSGDGRADRKRSRRH